MELSFAMPAPELAPFVSIYYRVFFDYPQIEDFERADVGYLRLMFGGHGFYNYPGGQRDPDCPVMLLGPATTTARYSITGPLDSFGCVLLPEFWGGIVNADANSYANRARDGVPLLGDEALYDLAVAALLGRQLCLGLEFGKLNLGRLRGHDLLSASIRVRQRATASSIAARLAPRSRSRPPPAHSTRQSAPRKLGSGSTTMRPAKP